MGEDEKKSRVDYSVREGKAAENIVDFAHTENIDLLIICTHGSSGLSRWNISSVTQKVINLIYLPVLIIRSYDRAIIDDNIKRYPEFSSRLTAHAVLSVHCLPGLSWREVKGLPIAHQKLMVTNRHSSLRQ